MTPLDDKIKAHHDALHSLRTNGRIHRARKTWSELTEAIEDYSPVKNTPAEIVLMIAVAVVAMLAGVLIGRM